MHIRRVRNRAERVAAALVGTPSGPPRALVGDELEAPLHKMISTARLRNPDRDDDLYDQGYTNPTDGADQQFYVYVHYHGFLGSNADWVKLLDTIAREMEFECRYDPRGDLMPLFIDLNLMGVMIHEDLMLVARELDRIVGRFDEDTARRIRQLSDALKVGHHAGKHVHAVWRNTSAPPSEPDWLPGYT